MSAWMIRAAAAVGFAGLVWVLFRFAMGLRWEMISREAARRAQTASGRRVVAELPVRTGDFLLFLETGSGFEWGGAALERTAIRGARVLLNGGVLDAFCREGALPDPTPPDDFEGKERWEVAVFLRDGSRTVIDCGGLREGVSREIAAKVFAAIRG